jgi:hypothetical protein
MNTTTKSAKDKKCRVTFRDGSASPPGLTSPRARPYIVRRHSAAPGDGVSSSSSPVGNAGVSLVTDIEHTDLDDDVSDYDSDHGVANGTTIPDYGFSSQSSSSTPPPSQSGSYSQGSKSVLPSDLNFTQSFIDPIIWRFAPFAIVLLNNA